MFQFPPSPLVKVKSQGEIFRKMGKKPKNWSYLGGYFTHRLYHIYYHSFCDSFGRCPLVCFVLFQGPNLGNSAVLNQQQQLNAMQQAAKSMGMGGGGSGGMLGGVNPMQMAAAINTLNNSGPGMMGGMNNRGGMGGRGGRGNSP